MADSSEDDGSTNGSRVVLMSNTAAVNPERMIRRELFAFVSPYGIVAPMVFLQGFLPYVQIALAVALIVAILLQRTGASLGGAFGADNFSSGFHTRRGLEKTLFYATIIIGILFAVSALITLLTS